MLNSLTHICFLKEKQIYSVITRDYCQRLKLVFFTLTTSYLGCCIFFTDSSIHEGLRPKDLFIAKEKQKQGQVDRWVDLRSLIGKNMFSSSSHVEKFIGMHVTIDGFEPKGMIERPFGKSGKFTAVFSEDLINGKGEIEGKTLTLIYDVNVLDVKREKWNVETSDTSHLK